MIVSEAELKVILGYGDQLDPPEHAALQAFHGQAEDAVKRYLKYDPEQKTHVEFYPRATPAGGMGYGGSTSEDINAGKTNAVLRNDIVTRSSIGESLQLRHLPIRQVTSVIVDRDGKFGQGAGGPFDDVFDIEFDGGDENLNKWVEGEDYWVEYDMPGVCRSGCLMSHNAWPFEGGSVRVEYVAGYSQTELSGRADEKSAAADDTIGKITSEHVSAAGIARAVSLTVVKMMHSWQNLKRNNTSPVVGGFAGGSTFQSEKAQDYSYTRPSQSATANLVGMTSELSAEAIMALREFRHYGIMRL